MTVSTLVGLLSKSTLVSDYLLFISSIASLQVVTITPLTQYNVMEYFFCDMNMLLT